MSGVLLTVLQPLKLSTASCCMSTCLGSTLPIRGHPSGFGLVLEGLLAWVCSDPLKGQRPSVGNCYVASFGFPLRELCFYPPREFGSALENF